MGTLFEIADEYRADLAKLADADLPADVIMDTLEAIQGSLNDKVQAVLAYSSNLEATAEARAAEAARLTDSAKTLRNKAENMRTYVQIVLQNTGVKLPLVLPLFTVNLNKLPPSCDIQNEAEVPAPYKTETLTFTGPAGFASSLVAAIQRGDITLPETVAHTVDTKISKKALLESLKLIAEANAKKPNEEGPDSIPGARLKPLAYRLTVR